MTLDELITNSPERQIYEMLEKKEHEVKECKRLLEATFNYIQSERSQHFNLPENYNIQVFRNWENRLHMAKLDLLAFETAIGITLADFENAYILPIRKWRKKYDHR